MTLLLRAKAARAAHDVVPLWPLDSFIAVNPLDSLQDRPFEHASEVGIATTRDLDDFFVDFRRGRIRARDLEAAVCERVPELTNLRAVRVGAMSRSAARITALELELAASGPADQVAPSPSPQVRDGLDIVDHIATKWVSAYLGHDPLWPMPHRDKGLYGAWSRMARFDPDLPARARKRLKSLETSADDALATALTQLDVTDDSAELAMRAELNALPGWTAHLKWRAEHVGDVDLTSYLALRFTMKNALGLSVAGTPVPQNSQREDPRRDHEPADELWRRAERVALAIAGEAEVRPEDIGRVARVIALHPTKDHRFTWQRAYELNYQARLLGALSREQQKLDRPASQLVMCIDPRSEGMRRHLESDSTIETLGFAGFFGVPIRFVGHGARGGINSLPALLAPKHSMTEEPVHPRQARRQRVRLSIRDALATGIHAGERVTAAPFALAETAGWFLGIATALRTLAPHQTARVVRWLSTLTSPEVATTVTIADTFTVEERAAIAETGVRMMGLNRFAPLVVLAGHGSRSTNNLYESALDCGACGGNPGDVNARAAAAIFNDPGVREILAGKGIDVPADTFFVAAEHDTVSDHIVPLDTHLVPQTHRAALARFGTMQNNAADALVRERARDLPGASESHSAARTRRRASDWAEVYPELGLAGNAAFLIAPREISHGVDLQRRVFLHSYRPELDPDGTALETIMTAPVVVAQWINHQYYFSALNPDRLGSGTKTIHNAIGTIGVISGQGGDLRQGLPWQSVGVGSRLIHEPMRLAVIVQAPLARIGEIVANNQVLRSLFDNGWITLTAREDAAHPWHRYGKYGWSAIAAPASNPEGAHS